MPDLEERAARLEEESYFQNRRLEELSEVLLAQQKQLDSLEKTLTLALKRLDELRDALAGTRSAEAPADLPPPHYQTW